MEDIPFVWACLCKKVTKPVSNLFSHTRGIFPFAAYMACGKVIFLQAFSLKGNNMSQINISHLAFAYEGSFDTVFDDVSVTLDTDWKLGLTGRNGCGKTTLLKLLCGGMEYQGNIRADVAFDYFPFEAEDLLCITMDMITDTAQCEQWQASREASLLELAEDALWRPFTSLSNGERTKAVLSALFLKQGNFLLIDEPTNHLDSRARGVVAEYLRRKKGFILVSHDRTFLDGCIDHVLSINRTNIEVQSGNFSTWMENKQRQDAHELERNKLLKKEIRRLEQTARQKAEWSDRVEKTKKGARVAGLRPDRGAIGHKAAKMMKRAKTVEERTQKAVEEKAGLLKNIEKAEKIVLKPLVYHTQRLWACRNLKIYYGEKTVCEHVELMIGQGERIALTGKNGCGKSSLLKLIVGESIPYTGEAHPGSGLKISYIPQDTSFLEGTLDAFIAQHMLDKTLMRTLLRKLDFSRGQFEKDLGDLSGGQKKKVLIAKSLCESAHLYVWDEPLNFIDVVSRMQVEELLRGCGAAMIFVEHDAAFVRNVATRQVRL